MLKKLLSILLSFLILLGNMGFKMATHYCGGEVVETQFALGQAHVGCGMEMDSEPCESSSIGKKNCCEDEYLSMNLENNYNTQVKSLNVNQVFLYAFTYTYFHFQSTAENVNPVKTDTSPPPLKQSRQVLFQTFLI